MLFKQSLYNFFEFISPVFSIEKLISKSNQNVFLPFYHSISNENLKHIKNIYPVRTEKLFLQDLDFITKNFKNVDLNFIINNLTSAKPVFHLSFDDGLSEVYTVIAPILLQKGINASFFVNTDFIDNKDLFYRYKASLIIENFKTKPKSIINKINNKLDLNLTLNNFNNYVKSIDYNNKDILDKIAKVLEIDFNEYLKINKPYLTIEQINYLINNGFTIGTHSCSHPEFRKIILENQIAEVENSMKFICENFNIKNKIFSFPFTDFQVDKQFFNYIYDNNIIDFSFGTAGIKIDEFKNHFQRFSIDGTNKSAEKLIKAEYLYFLFKRFFNKEKIYRN